MAMLGLGEQGPYMRCMYGVDLFRWTRILKARFLNPEVVRVQGRLSKMKDFDTCEEAWSNWKCEVGTAINCYIFIIKAYLVNWWSPGCLDIAAIRYLMQKYWTIWSENHVFEYIHIYIFYIHVGDTYANGIVKKKKEKRKDNPQL